jgi:hypothetical protein
LLKRRGVRALCYRDLLAPLAAAAAVLAVLFVGRALLLPTAPATLALRQQDGVWYEGATRLPEVGVGRRRAVCEPARHANAQRRRARRARRATASAESRQPRTGEPHTRVPLASRPDAARYRVRLERADTGEPVPLVVEGTQARLAPNTTLQAGARYRLTIEALAAGEVAGEGLTGVYEFRTLTPDEQTRLRWARANRQNAPRTCVALFYQLGFYADALETLNALPQDDPLVQKWRAVLSAYSK